MEFKKVYNCSKEDGEKDERYFKDIITFDISGTSKFPSSKEVANAFSSGRSPEIELSVRKTFAYGSKYGLGVFCVLLSGEQQIGWVPEKDRKLYERINLIYQQPSFCVKLIKATSKRISETFSRIDITISCRVK